MITSAGTRNRSISRIQSHQHQQHYSTAAPFADIPADLPSISSSRTSHAARAAAGTSAYNHCDRPRQHQRPLKVEQVSDACAASVSALLSAPSSSQLTAARHRNLNVTVHQLRVSRVLGVPQAGARIAHARTAATIAASPLALKSAHHHSCMSTASRTTASPQRGIITARGSSTRAS